MIDAKRVLDELVGSGAPGLASRVIGSRPSAGALLPCNVVVRQVSPSRTPLISWTRFPCSPWSKTRWPIRWPPRRMPFWSGSQRRCKRDAHDRKPSRPLVMMPRSEGTQRRGAALASAIASTSRVRRTPGGARSSRGCVTATSTSRPDDSVSAANGGGAGSDGVLPAACRMRLMSWMWRGAVIRLMGDVRASVRECSFVTRTPDGRCDREAGKALSRNRQHSVSRPRFSSDVDPGRRRAEFVSASGRIALASGAHRPECTRLCAGPRRDRSRPPSRGVTPRSDPATAGHGDRHAGFAADRR
ncbi:hypothetical protein ThimaDRAFT_1793 [Thiocapsa marina 5811]|uniref:DUF302 domain-containing protein n=1 Tax=Thiocapsa marina 5811 TaxID=768671 RepID=F9UA41_9GAMM|nr:hypothetical protein ThimaDRAFT_1793 [Thiocapsa marina 5811]